MLYIFARIALVVLFTTTGYLYGMKYGSTLYGVTAGLFFGIFSILVESRLKGISFGSVLGGLLGLSIGLIYANLLLLPLRYIITDEARTLSAFVLNTVLGFGGFLSGLHKGKNLTIPAIMRLFKGHDMEEDLKILDTSVIIDGRIADIMEVGFLQGTFIIPQFILQELQYIADSPDPMRRSKGRRGLDILHRIQKLSNIKVRIVEEDFPKIKEVDSKLVALARLFNAKVITNDFNLNKVAQVQGVSVLNINELANVLKPVVLPGETLNLFIVKEGKEYNQGVAYLDDGTMVVIENARKLIGKNAEIVVTSVLQTTAGRMIFGKLKEEE